MVFAALGCNLNNPGDEPPRGLLYFPNAMAISKPIDGNPPRYLFIGNSNFDLRYSHGSVQAFSLEKLQQSVDDKNCRKKPACEINPAEPGLLQDEVLITSFNTTIGLSADDRYLFAATRTDSSLIFVHVNVSANGDKVLSCKGNETICSLRAQRGFDANATDEQRIAWPADPEALISGPLSDWQQPGETEIPGDYVLVAHRAGAVSMFVLRPDHPDDEQCQNDLTHCELAMGQVLGTLPGALTEVAYDPATRLVYLPVAAIGTPKLLARVGMILGTTADGGPDIEQMLAYDAGSLSLEGVPQLDDTRDVKFIPAIPAAGEALAEDRALVVSGQPSALLLTDVNKARNPVGVARVKRTTIVGPGATRVVVGNFDGHPLAVVGSFASREITIIDLPTMLTRAVVPNLSGPYAIVLDEARKLVYIGDFRSSVIRIIDLAPVLDPESTEEVRVIATLGHPRVLQELK